MNSSQESPRNWLNQGQIGRKAAYAKNPVPILTGGLYLLNQNNYKKQMLFHVYFIFSICKLISGLQAIY